MKRTTVLYRIFRGLLFVGICALAMVAVNHRVFFDSKEQEPARFDYPYSRSVVEFDRDVFRQAVALSDWAEINGSTLRPRAGQEDRFRSLLNPNQLSVAFADDRKGFKWDEGAPSLSLETGKRGYYLVPAWVLWAFRTELQSL